MGHICWSLTSNNIVFPCASVSLDFVIAGHRTDGALNNKTYPKDSFLNVIHYIFIFMLYLHPLTLLMTLQNRSTCISFISTSVSKETIRYSNSVLFVELLCRFLLQITTFYILQNDFCELPEKKAACKPPVGLHPKSAAPPFISINEEALHLAQQES